MRKHIVSDAPALSALVHTPPRGLSSGEWWQILAAAHQDACLLMPECSLNRLLGPGIHPAKARVMRDQYLRAYQTTAAARYGVTRALVTRDLSRRLCSPEQQPEDNGEPTPDYTAGA